MFPTKMAASTLISIKTKPEIKKKAMKYFEEQLGISLSAGINIFLHNIAQGKAMNFELGNQQNDDDMLRFEKGVPANEMLDFIKKTLKK